MRGVQWVMVQLISPSPASPKLVRGSAIVYRFLLSEVAGLAPEAVLLLVEVVFR